MATRGHARPLQSSTHHDGDLREGAGTLRSQDGKLLAADVGWHASFAVTSHVPHLRHKRVGR